MTPSPPHAWRTRDTLAALTLFLATASFVLWQNTHVAVLWDLSYLLDSSYRFTLGQLPYKDIPFVHAPLTFLLQAAIIKLAGRVYFPHILYAALAGGAATVLTWRLLLGVLRPLAQQAWSIATLLAAPLIFLGIYGIYPHPIYDSDATLAVLLALALTVRSSIAIEPSAPGDLPSEGSWSFAAGATSVLPLFFKQNIGLLFLLATLAVVSVIGVARRMRRLSLAPQLWFFAGAAATLATSLLILHATVGIGNYYYWTVQFAAQRRLPGLGLILGIYHQTSLLWTIPCALAGLILLRWKSPGARHDSSGAPFVARSHRDMGGMRYRFIAIALLAAPFLWTIASLALTDDPSDRGEQLLSLWPHLLLLSTALALWNLRRPPTFQSLLPLVLLATIHGTFLSQQLWGSTYAIWPLLTLLIAALLTQVPAVARPLAAIVAVTFLLCGGLYAASHDRLSYIHLDDPETHATLTTLRGLTTPGPWIPAFEELVRVTNAEIPANDGILLIPGEDPFYFATGRTPRFPILLFDPATDPYTAQQTLEQARAHNIRWLIVSRSLQLTGPPHPGLPEIVSLLQQDFAPYRSLTNYDIYRRR